MGIIMIYFRLNIDCFLVAGKKGSALYNVNSQKIYLLDQESGRLLEECEGRQPLKQEWLHGKFHSFLDLLVREGLGCYYPYPVYVDKMLLDSPLNRVGGMLSPWTDYKVMSWSITNQCDHNCHFCPNDLQQPLWQACRSCVRRDNAIEDPALFADPISFLKQMTGLGIWGLHIRGGNPLLEWARLTGILHAANSFPHLKIAVTTPGTGLPVNDILSLYDNFPNFKLNVTLLGFNEDPDKSLADGTDAAIDQFKLLDVLRERNAPFDIIVVISDQTPADRESASAQIFNRWGIMPHFAEFYPLPDKNKTDFRFSSIQKNKKTLYMWRTAKEFFHRVNNSICLQGGFEVAVNGSIKPCAGCGHDCGKVFNNRLTDALKGDFLYNLWKQGKDKVAQCADCALRFACIDCLAADLLGATNRKVASGYCPVMEDSDLYAKAGSFEHQDCLHLLSVERGLE
jgi:MoaA/NifB/PqqE/SkfB family radical SAM enzyme